MINLLFFGSDFAVGLTTALSEQILELKKQPEISLSCVSSEKEMEPGLHQMMRDNEVNMNIIPELDVHKNFILLANSVEKIIEDNKITHVNVHNNWQLAIVSYLKYKRFLPKPFKIIYTIHGYRHNSYLKSILAIGVIGFALLCFADRVISMSSYVSRRFWFVKYKTNLVYYIMNKPEFNKTDNHISASPLKMVFPAQFRKGKNQDLLINAVELYIKKTGDSHIQLYLPGDGYLLKDCQALVKEKNLEENVFFPGKLAHEKVIQLYEDSNIALVSSNVETYGRCIAEPFALGRCLITKKTGVALDIIKDKANGFFFSNETELVSILSFLRKNPQKIIDVANNAFRDKSVFTSEEVMGQYFTAIKNA